MMTIIASELKSNLEKYFLLAAEEDIFITCSGVLQNSLIQTWTEWALPNHCSGFF